ncbi:phospholipase D-like domain-containing protein [Isoalcanivorax indicus]|uniref:phospholipase D-like domain-containing protein n=1 Tax=Isoalcanivorax indicus TaxID=2202653 RepID=UPI000DB95652|nr:phosphatidylserine/phosphatidylglycerophosphate/cardiolipin synthase family protein [Isoalcanivorax indicus]
MVDTPSAPGPRRRTLLHAAAESTPRLSWPWRSRCTLSIQAGGQRYLPHIRTAMQGARKSICVELYMCNAGALFDEWLGVWAAAVARGVEVRLLLDAIGSLGLRDEDAERLCAAGVTLQWFNPVRTGHLIATLVRDHRKLIIVDDQRAWVGGMGIDDRYDPRISGEEAWMDAMVACEGPVVADFRSLFDQAWHLAAAGPLTGAVRWRLGGHPRPAARRAHADTTWARVNGSRGGRNNPLMRTLVRRVLRAREGVWLCTPYFLPPRSLLKALLYTARRGVPVHLTLCGQHTDHPWLRYAGQHYYQRLLEAGVHISEYDARFLHLKAAQADQWSTLGSFNYDRWNSSWNLEANVEAVDGEFADHVRALRERLDKESVHISAADWAARSHWQRWRNAFWNRAGLRLIKVLGGLWRVARQRPGGDG